MAGPRPMDAGRHAADPVGRPAPAPRDVVGSSAAARPRPTPYPRSGSAPPGGPQAAPGPASDDVPPVAGSTHHGNVVTDPLPVAAAAPDETPAACAAPPREPTGEDGGQSSGVDVWDLVRRAQAGDAEAFGELYDHYVSLVHRYAHHRVGDRATAEDVTSETFVRALRRIDTLSFQGRDVGAWLITIARNIIRDQVKSSRYRLEVSTADMRDADTATDGPEDAVVRRLTNEELVACIRRLGSEQQECLALRFLHGLSVSETAQVMGKREGAIKALQHRAVRRLAALLPEGLR
jgi:RNA polymerase sigma-70 factor (TIGR02952 family)